MSCFSVRVPGKVWDHARYVETHGSIQQFSYVARAGIECDKRLSEIPRALQCVPHKCTANTEPTGLWMDYHFCDLAAMRLVWRHGCDELHRANKLAVMLGPEEDSPFSNNVRSDVA